MAYSLLRAGAQVNVIDCKSRTPLLTALHWKNDSVARFLVHAGASVNRVPGSARSPLHMVVASNNLSLAHLMLEYGAVVVDLLKDDLNWTVIHSTCESGNNIFGVE